MGRMKDSIPNNQTKIKKGRFKNSTLILRDIRKKQKGLNLLISRAPVRRMFNEAMREFNSGLRMSKEAVDIIHEATEANIIGVLEDSHLAALHAKRVTVMGKDLSIARRIRGELTKNQYDTEVWKEKNLIP